MGSSDDRPTPEITDQTLEIRVKDVPLPPEPTDKSAYLTVLMGPATGQAHKIRSERTVIGRAPGVDLVVDDEGVSRRHAEIVSGRNKQFVLIDMDSRNGVFFRGRPVRRHVLQDGDRFQIGETTVVKFSFQDELEENYQRKLYEDAVRDGLTGVFNARYFREQLVVELAYCARHESVLSLMLLDVDHFKQVNDNHGHLVGDRVLRELAETIGGIVRKEDLLARYGGEEFVLILRDTESDLAMVVAERIRETIKARNFGSAREPIRVTVSIGLATLHRGNYASASELIAAADSALYDAKSSGRDCSVTAQSPGRGRESG